MGATPDAIEAHYDVSDEFYQLWLGSTMVYSGALWADGDDLDRAQARKMSHHIAAIQMQPGHRILEVGCGWGTLLRMLVEQQSASRAVGLTLSRAQYERVRAFPITNIEVRLESWQQHESEIPYDGIISIGAFEHFARLDFDERDKVNVYRNFFEKSRTLLRRQGRLSLQTFAYGSANNRENAANKASTRFLAEEVFRETDPPRLANIADAIEGKFEMVCLHNDRDGYARTCRTWLHNLRANKTKAEELVGRETFDRFERYLNYSYIGFISGNLDLYRITLQRIEPRSRTRR